ncbi:MAG: bifunctional tetrahydrofolate synthase/dihydrofolate synthase [Thiomonas sp. 13-66-29]|jgi:dihydrofolate synthase/folylpolyglutamate synthase|nr:bifunctional tetrahydrofolate synthase/dihydrofolate synthase [Thiomonas sp.]OZB63329.1 MAG: bifunctional tetrahydrofolate synthase/dihydrofolate synthase [Thiomonas sp. 13-66-29]
MQDWGLQDWLAHAERLHAQAIHLGLDRVEKVRASLQLRFDCPVFTVAGTNGKGSTCAFIERILLAAGYRVGVYGSPHLVRFEERCRIQGTMVEAAALLEHFRAVELARHGTQPAVELTYFEFTTLAIMRLLSQSKLDAVVLEVGMGGRLDAVNVIDADCAIITSIALDHTQFLGADREAIGHEKAGIMRAGRPAIVADPAPPESVLRHARKLGAKLWRIGAEFNFSASGQQQWNYLGPHHKRRGLAYPMMRGANQLLNASAALAALEALRDRLPTSAQDVRQGLARAELPGRFQVLPGQPVVVLDVAHNPHAVAVLAENLDAMGFAPCTHAVFGAMADKDVAQMLARIGPLVDRWYLCDLPTPRAARASDIEAALQPLLSKTSRVQGVYADPQNAFAAAAAAAEPADRIVVFGSFYTVGGVMAEGVPRMRGLHSTHPIP